MNHHHVHNTSEPSRAADSPSTRRELRRSWPCLWRLGLIAVALLFTVAASACGGCTTTIIAPDHVDDPVDIYIVDYGRHAGLLMPDGDGRLVEFTYGDWAFYAQGRTSLVRGVWVLLVPTQATLGRQSYDIHPNGGLLARRLGAEVVFHLTVERGLVEALRSELQQRYEAKRDTEIYNATHDRYFVKHDVSYILLHNCNHRMVMWLESLGFESRGTAIYSNWRILDGDGNALDVASRPDDPPHPRSRTK